MDKAEEISELAKKFSRYIRENFNIIYTDTDSIYFNKEGEKE